MKMTKEQKESYQAYKDRISEPTKPIKLRVTYNYHDRKLGFEKRVGDEFDVTDERGQVLIAAGVAEEIVEPVEEPEAQEGTEEEEKPKRSTKARK